MEDHVEMEEDSTSNVPVLEVGGTFIVVTVHGTVTEPRNSTKRHRPTENVSEDLLNRHIQVYGLVSPERTKNVVWYFFRKYNSKKLQGRDDNLKLTQYVLYTICLTDLSYQYLVLFTGTIENTFSVLGTIHDCVLYFPKKKLTSDAPDAEKIGTRHGSSGESPSSVSEPIFG
jgi:hypothetical protein